MSSLFDIIYSFISDFLLLPIVKALIEMSISLITSISFSIRFGKEIHKFLFKVMYKTIIKHEIVLEDEEKKLYTIVQEKDKTITAVMDPDKKNIKYYNEGQSIEELMSKKIKFANDSESLAFNCAVDLLPKNTNKGTSQAEVTKDVDLIMNLLKKKSKTNTYTYYILLITLALEFGFGFFNPLFFDKNVVIFTCILYALSLINQFVLKYRVKKGLYGTRYFEAKEIISYIVSEQNNSTGSGKAILVFPKEEVDLHILLKRIRSEEHA